MNKTMKTFIIFGIFAMIMTAGNVCFADSKTVDDEVNIATEQYIDDLSALEMEYEDALDQIVAGEWDNSEFEARKKELTERYYGKVNAIKGQ